MAPITLIRIHGRGIPKNLDNVIIPIRIEIAGATVNTAAGIKGQGDALTGTSGVRTAETGRACSRDCRYHTGDYTNNEQDTEKFPHKNTSYILFFLNKGDIISTL